MRDFLVPLGAIGAAFAIAYGGVKLLLGNPEDSLVKCNDNIQGFLLDGVQIYWRVFEGTCRPADLNYDAIRTVVESLLQQRKKHDVEWPEAQCEYGTVASGSYVWSYGTDYYEIEETDCLEPLREMQREKEENMNVAEYLKSMVVDKKQDVVGAVINNFF